MLPLQLQSKLSSLGSRSAGAFAVAHCLFRFFARMPWYFLFVFRSPSASTFFRASQKRCSSCFNSCLTMARRHRSTEPGHWGPGERFTHHQIVLIFSVLICSTRCVTLTVSLGSCMVYSPFSLPFASCYYYYSKLLDQMQPPEPCPRARLAKNPYHIRSAVAR